MDTLEWRRRFPWRLARVGIIGRLVGGGVPVKQGAAP